MALLPLVNRAIARLAEDLASGRWAARNAELLEQNEMDLSYRLLVSRET